MRLLNDDATSYLEHLGSQTYRRRRIFHIDYAPFPLLVSLIRGAKAVLFPSLYEGFGLPVLEAMKLGTPVLTSMEGSTPEVAGDGALLIDPYDTRAIANGIKALDSNEALRNELSAKGRVQADKFTADAYKVRLRALYDGLLANRPYTNLASRVGAPPAPLLNGPTAAETKAEGHEAGG
jgi:glycosyltransferase involved in cell wall biosynthesis